MAFKVVELLRVPDDVNHNNVYVDTNLCSLCACVIHVCVCACVCTCVRVCVR